MARYSVYALRSGAIVLDCQADLLSHLQTRFVVPLVPLEGAPVPLARLNPVFEVGGRRLVMATHLCAAIPSNEIAEEVDSLAGQDSVIANALDMLLLGF